MKPALTSLHIILVEANGDQAALCNQTRRLLCEFGIVLNQGVATLRKALPRIMEDAENGLTSIFREALSYKHTQLKKLDDLALLGIGFIVGEIQNKK